MQSPQQQQSSELGKELGDSLLLLVAALINITNVTIKINRAYVLPTLQKVVVFGYSKSQQNSVIHSSTEAVKKLYKSTSDKIHTYRTDSTLFSKLLGQGKNKEQEQASGVEVYAAQLVTDETVDQLPLIKEAESQVGEAGEASSSVNVNATEEDASVAPVSASAKAKTKRTGSRIKAI